MTQNPFVIAIDGPAASGKGTLARNLAANLDFAYLDTGALYRALAYELIENKRDFYSKDDVLSACSFLNEKMTSGHLQEYLSNPALRTEKISKQASKVASLSYAREALLEVQRIFAKTPKAGCKGVILDGRDIGTVVCPDADLKFFLIATSEIRAYRRMKELQSKGIEAKYEAVLADLRERDLRDSGRQAAPLKSAKDAIVLDSSNCTEDEILGEALKIIEKSLNR